MITLPKSTKINGLTAIFLKFCHSLILNISKACQIVVMLVKYYLLDFFLISQGLVALGW